MQFLARVRRPVSREIAYKPTELSTIKLRHFYLIEEGKLNGEILLCFDLNWSGSSVYCRCVKREERKKRERRKRKRINGLSLSNFSWFISPKMLVFHGDCCKNPGFASMVYKFALEIPYALNDRCVCLLIMVWNLWHCFYLLIITFVCWFCLFTITFTLRFVFHSFSSIVPCILRYWNFAVFVFLKCIVCTSVFLHFKRFFFYWIDNKLFQSASIQAYQIHKRISNILNSVKSGWLGARLASLGFRPREAHESLLLLLPLSYLWSDFSCPSPLHAREFTLHLLESFLSLFSSSPYL